MVLKVRAKAQPLPGCPMSTCMQLIGGLWTPEILWALSEGPRRFSEIKRDCALISAKVLTSRLRDLECRDVISRHVMPTSPPTVEYALTALGMELLPAIKAIVDVGTKLHANMKLSSAENIPDPLPD